MSWLAFLRVIPAILKALVGPILYFMGRRSAKKDTKIDNLTDYRKTRERMDDAEIQSDPAAARDWLRDRDTKRP